MPVCVFGVCLCQPGYAYKGPECVEQENPRLTLEAVPQCYGTSCACPKGYSYNGDLQSCDFEYVNIPAQDVHCDLSDSSQCGMHASCIFDAGYDHSTCQCDRDFIGDGFECEAFSSEAIDSYECSRHSQCILDEKCVLTFANSQFAYKCVVRDPLKISGGLVQDYDVTKAPTRPGKFLKK